MHTVNNNQVMRGVGQGGWQAHYLGALQIHKIIANLEKYAN